MILFLTSDPKVIKILSRLAAKGVHLPCFMVFVNSSSPFSLVLENTNGFTSKPQSATRSHLPTHTGYTFVDT